MKKIIIVFFSMTIVALSIHAMDDWIQKYPDPNPSARVRHTMAYIGGDQMLLFGGLRSVGGTSNETWVYDLSDNTWIQKSPASQPSARYMHAMAYISGDQVVLFGGSSGSDETWVYDLSANTWTQKSPASKPSCNVASILCLLCLVPLPSTVSLLSIANISELLLVPLFHICGT